jgi:hypothetical protein
MRALAFAVFALGIAATAFAQEAPPSVVPASVAPPPAPSGSSARPVAALPGDTASAPAKRPVELAADHETRRRIMMLMMMRDAAAGFPGALLRPIE